jgi:hypothetical protein
MSSSTSKNRRSFRRALVLGLATAAIAPAAASAYFEDPQSGPNQQQMEIPYLSHGVGITRPAPVQAQGGVTPTNLARSYVAPAQERESGVTPNNLARAYVSPPKGYEALLSNAEPIPTTPTVETASASGSGIDTEDLFRGFILGAALALAAALALSAVRAGPRVARS